MTIMEKISTLEIWKKKYNKNQGTKDILLGTLYYPYLTDFQDRYLALEPLYPLQHQVLIDLWKFHSVCYL